MEAASKEENAIAADSRIVRYDDLVPCLGAFIDSRTPGSDKKENFTIIGPGVSENPDQHIHIAEPHGFNIGGARQPPGCTNSQHSHNTAEVFYIHKGKWAFTMGEFGDDTEIILKPGDLISIPTNVFRGFENVGEDMGYLWAVLGGDDPGRVLWAPKVFDMAKDYGLVLLENGSLIDTTKGEVVPKDAKVMPVTTREQIEALDKYDFKDLRECCIMSEEDVLTEKQGSVSRRKLIGEDAKLGWPHGFSVSEYRVNAGEEIIDDKLNKPDVIFVHEGELRLVVNDDIWDLKAGDTATIPKQASRRFENAGQETVTFVRVIGD